MAKEAVSIARHEGTVRLTMSARVANDLGSLQKGLRSLADRLGHSACATGCDILHLGMERQFVISEKVELNPQPLPPRDLEISQLAAIGQPAAPARTVTVSIPARVNDDIEGLTRTVAAVVDKLGCRACCSGFDILFRRELDFLAVDENIRVAGFGRFR